MASGYYDVTSKTLGKGHYGVVKLGRHCLTGEPVAIKIIEKSRLNPDSFNQLGTEIRILFRLSEYEHPNILKLYQTIDSEDKLFLITEYCGPHACDLHDYLSRKHCRDGLSEIEAQIFFIQICSAISYCHSMGIVHRDLKPENILVTDFKHMNSEFYNASKHFSLMKDHQNNNNNNNNQHRYPLLKLIDFGFANQWYADEKMRTSCGTLAYSAPELLLGEPYDGTKVDVWGLGLMLYILLYGGNPFMQINDNETLTRILDCSFATPKRENVDIDAEELLRSLIKRNPDTRLPIDAILKHKWFSTVPKTFETLLIKTHIKTDLATAGAGSVSPSTSCNSTTPPSGMHVQSSNKPQLPQQNKLTSLQNMSSFLPSISEIGPLRNLNRSVDDTAHDDKGELASHKPKYNRTRSLSITRSHSKSNQQPQQQQATSLTHTRSSLSLDRRNSAHQLTPSRANSIYRPTSPDVGGNCVAPTEEENRLHESVINEMFRLTKLIDCKSSIEASLKNARFLHRQFNHTSIKPAVISKRELTSGLAKLLGHRTARTKPTEQELVAGENKSNPEAKVDAKLGMINTKLSNDDYIYATYQLTRDRLLRVKKEKLRAKIGNDRDGNLGTGGKKSSSTNAAITGYPSIKSEEEDGPALPDQVSAKENSRQTHQRRLLQPQHRMRDKFTSFFRSESTSPNGSFSVSCDSQASGGDSSLKEHVSLAGGHHEAFNDHDNEHSATFSSRYYANKSEIQDSSLAYSLPLARKCSLVSEESGCSNEPPES